MGWSYIVRYDPRGRPIEYNVVEEDANFEEDDDVEAKLVDDHVLDHEDVEEVKGDVQNNVLGEDDIDDVMLYEEVEPNVGDDVHHDEMDYDMIIGKDDIEDDAKIVDHGSVIFETNGINVDKLDEEED